MTTEINIITLGQLRVQQNGQTVNDFISTKAALLFVYLAMHPGEHTRKKLASMFWSATHDQQALKNLRTVLANIRQNLPDALLIERDDLAINPDIAVQVDASRFERGCEAVLVSPNPSAVLKEMQDLAELVQGEFLADVSFREAPAVEDWIAEQQRKVHQLHTRLLSTIVQVAEAHGDYETGMRYAGRLVRFDSYSDDANRQWMRLLAYTNRANEALLHYEAFARLLADELGAEPEDETSALADQIRARQIRPPRQRVPRTSIVLADMPFVEPPDDLALVERMLSTPQCRLLTIYGISGVGKTTLATQVAYQRQQLYRDGAYFISLKRSQTARDLPPLIAATLEIGFTSQTPAAEVEELVLSHLRTHHSLLVLDGYEHLLPETGFLQKLLEQAAQVQVIVTSQSSLNLFREWLLPLSGLRVPDADADHPERYEAVRLFELTAQRINPRFNLRDNLADIVEICRLVDGLPLAIILAAGWTQILPIHKIKEFVVEGQEFTLPLHQELPPHHQSIEMMLDYTWNTLSPAEQYALTALSIFNTSFDMDEVAHICEIDLLTLTLMLQKSLVQRYGDRYRMHQLVWRYARRKLLYSDKREVLAGRYLDYAVEALRGLQAQKLPLHEYLLGIEMQYAPLWNFDWMPKSFQPLYVLTLSRFLIAYWEISRLDDLPELQQLFSGVRPADLSAEMRLLLYLQLARFYLRSGQPEPAYDCLCRILLESAVGASWADWSAVMSLCVPILQARYADPSATAPQDDYEQTILFNYYLNLLFLYLDMGNYEEAQGFFPYLLEIVDLPRDHALFLTAQGTLLAQAGHFSDAFSLLTEALGQLQGDREPLVVLTLHTLLMRAARQLGRATDTGDHFCAALALSSALDAAPARQQLTQFAADYAAEPTDFSLVDYCATA